MIARESFEKSLPRRASATPFLCLIELHLLCPDTVLLSDELEKALVDARVGRQLRMERRHEEPSLAQEHRLALELREHLDRRPRDPNARRADEDSAQRPAVALQVEIGLEARHLASERVAAHLQVQQAEVAAVEQDHPGAGTEDRP